MVVLFGTAGIPLNCPTRTYRSAITELSKLGLRALEIKFLKNTKMKKESAIELKTLAKERKMSLSIHALSSVNLNTNNETKLHVIREYLLRCAQGAKELGAKTVVFSPGVYSKKSHYESYEIIRRNITIIRDYLDANGLNSVFLAPKTTGSQKKFGTVDEVISLCKGLCGMLPVLDFGHIYARRNGINDTKNTYLSTLYKCERSFGSAALKNMYIRFSAVEFKNGNEKRHLVLEYGSPKFTYVAEAMKEMHVSGTVICTSPILEDDALKMKKIYESIPDTYS